MCLRNLLLSLMLALPCGAAPVISSQFTVDGEGWTVTNDGASTAVTYLNSGGNPGGFIRRTDQSSGYMHFSAPAIFLGDRSEYLGGTVSYDLLQTTASADTPWYYREVLQGAGLLLLNTDPLTPDTNNWVHRSVSLTAGAWIVIADLESFSGPVATAGQFASVLANLTGFYITGDMISGTGDVASLDNVTFAAVPEPSTFGMLAAAAVLAVVARTRRR